jgi:hypothetical protein
MCKDTNAWKKTRIYPEGAQCSRSKNWKNWHLKARFRYPLFDKDSSHCIRGDWRPGRWPTYCLTRMQAGLPEGIGGQAAGHGNMLNTTMLMLTVFQHSSLVEGHIDIGSLAWLRGIGLMWTAIGNKLSRHFWWAREGKLSRRYVCGELNTFCEDFFQCFCHIQSSMPNSPTAHLQINTYTLPIGHSVA